MLVTACPQIISLELLAPYELSHMAKFKNKNQTFGVAKPASYFIQLLEIQVLSNSSKEYYNLI